MTIYNWCINYSYFRIMY